MEEIKIRKCIICQRELSLDRELTCSKPCAKKYHRATTRVNQILNKKKKPRCIICENELSLDYLRYCPNCQESYQRIKGYLLKNGNTNN